MSNFNSYPTIILDDKTSKKIECQMTCSMTKNIDCQELYDIEVILNKLERLKNDNFNRVKIPKFYYNVDGNTISYTCEFIKGIYAITPQQRSIIYEDIVLKDSNWSFCDYYYSNFIVENQTQDIYAIDFQSYCYSPDINFRIEDWTHTQSEEQELIKSLLFN
jgi:hypothetical protein